ncbi:MAG TPA: CPBP family intramembrane glutamic endopeptidase, partial [Symbiobacteriaceae bacterium]|nr:CPBP family intramembrane glutamic endopeptidase [Symbiobacteriaceae bacterium]
MIKRFVNTRPALFMSLYVLHTILLFPLLNWLFPHTNVMVLKLGIMAEMIGSAAALLWLMGWWREAGFNGLATWKSMHLHWLPLLLAASPVVILGFHVTDPKQLLGLLPVTLIIGLQEEMIFRGFAMRALLPGGQLRAVLITATLFGVMHIGNLFGGADLTYTLVQVLASILGGVGAGAIRVRTGTVWGLILVHAVNDYAMFVTRDEINVT